MSWISKDDPKPPKKMSQILRERAEKKDKEYGEFYREVYKMRDVTGQHEDVQVKARKQEAERQAKEIAEFKEFVAAGTKPEEMKDSHPFAFLAYENEVWRQAKAAQRMAAK